MKIHKHTIVQRTFFSEVQPDISTISPDLGQVIQWADNHPVVWEIVTKTRSKAFGRGSCEYIGCAQRSMSPEAVLERLRHFKNLIEGKSPYHTGDSIFLWRARFTLEHYKEKGFRGGFFQQHDSRYPRSCLTLDYTPETLEEVLDRFCAWMECTYDTQRITVDGKTVRVFKSHTKVQGS